MSACVRYREWEEKDGVHRLEGANGNGPFDVMAKIVRAGDGWRISWWDAPQTPDSRKTATFAGSLEEAKAYAVALVRF